MAPGRIQTIPNAGFYALSGGKEAFIQNGSFFLANNPNYSYYWADFNGDFPENTVYVRSANSPYTVPIARAKINGHMKVGLVVAKRANFPNDDGTAAERFANYEMLVCDPWPKYQCGK